MLKRIADGFVQLKRWDLPKLLVLQTNKTDTLDTFWCFALCVMSVALYALLVVASNGVAAERSIGGVWFQSDGWRVFDDMTTFEATHFRDSVHPLFSITFIPTTHVICHALKLSAIESIYVVNSALCAASSGMLYLIARGVGCARIDAILLTLTFMTSASSIFWSVVPETYPAGCATIVLCFYVLTLRPKGDLYFVAAASLSLSVTVTNWMAGLVVAATSRPPLRAALISLLSFLTVAFGALAAKQIFPHPGSPFFLPGAVKHESSFVAHADAGSLLDRLAGQLVTPMIAPEHKLLFNQPTGIMYSFQAMVPTTVIDGDVIFAAALAALLYLLGVSFFQTARHVDRFSACVIATLAGQMLLHTFYGEETFLYGLHFSPLIILLLVHAFRLQVGAGRRVALCLLLVLGVFNNTKRFSDIVNAQFVGTDEFLYRLNLYVC